MIYSFACPAPCNNEIRIRANNDEEAIDEMLMAGALRCRNSAYRCHCEKNSYPMSPLPLSELMDRVRLSIRTEVDDR